MFDLRIRFGSCPPLPRGDEPGLVVWRDIVGAVCALGETRCGENWMHFPGLASFRFGQGDRAVVAYAPPDTAREWIEDAFSRSVVPLALQALGTEVMHASGFLTPAGVVAVAAVAETGKSTLARAVARRGFAQWADDAVVFEARASEVVSRALPFASRLHADSAAALAADAPAARVDPTTTAALAAVLLIERFDAHDATPTVSWRLLTSAEAFPRVLEHAYCFTLDDDARTRRMITQYLDLATRVPVLSVRYRSGFEMLSEVVDGVLEAVTATCGVSTLR
jgi:hypothetical protein